MPDTVFSPQNFELRNGRRVTVRAVCQADRDGLQEAIRRLSPEARYARFMTPLRELGPELLERAVNPDQGCELQLVAVTGDAAGQTIVGGARYSGAPGSTVCEFALAVVDDWRGTGLARCLLETLTQAAQARGFETMEGHVLATNTRMLGLAKRLGFRRAASSEGPTVCLVRRDL